jgi:hypothetical protein
MNTMNTPKFEEIIDPKTGKRFATRMIVKNLDGTFWVGEVVESPAKAKKALKKAFEKHLAKGNF